MRISTSFFLFRNHSPDQDKPNIQKTFVFFETDFEYKTPQMFKKHLNINRYVPVAHQEEHLPPKEKVEGSNPFRNIMALGSAGSAHRPVTAEISRVRVPKESFIADLAQPG